MSYAVCRFPLIMALLVTATVSQAQIPTILTDTIKQGDGVIDVIQDVSPASLQDYLSDGTMFLGVDVNEDASGLEKASSQGVAIKEMELLIQTTAGDFSFTSFYTNTTAMIREAGATEAAEFHTLFGSSGSNEISSTSGTDFNISAFDDVIEIRDVVFAGDITGAQIRVKFVDTARNATDTEAFFDYSAGFEEFAILTEGDAQLLDNANIGFADAPETVQFTASTPSGGDIDSPSGAPLPPWALLAGLPLLLLIRRPGTV